MRYFGGGIGHSTGHLHAIDRQANNAMDVDICNGNEGQDLDHTNNDDMQIHGLELLAQQAVHDWAGNAEADADELEGISDEEESSGDDSLLNSESEDDEDSWDGMEDGNHNSSEDSHSDDLEDSDDGYGSP